MQNEIAIPAFHKLSYGLFVLTSRDGKQNAGCIVNTVIQITDSPKRITLAVNNANHTCDVIKKSGIFNVSIISRDADFDLFKHFGFQSGKNVDKFADFYDLSRASNGVYYVTSGTNAFISAKVAYAHDCGTHTLFIADVDEAQVLSNEKSATYEYYFENIKPKPQSNGAGWVCTICGYKHESPDLPPNFICPICKHGASDFKKL